MSGYRPSFVARNCVVFAGLLFIGLAFSASVHAQVRDWSIARARGFDQTANNTVPTIPVMFAAFGQVGAEVGDFAGAMPANGVTLEGAPGGTITFLGVDFGGGVADWEFEHEFPTLATLDAFLPTATYDIEAAGPLGDFTESITLAGDFSTNIPFFTGDTFDDLQGLDPAQAVTLSWNVPPTDGFFLVVEEVGTGNEPFFVEGYRNANSGQMSVVVPGGTLNSGSEYNLFIEFVFATDDARDGFQTGEGVSGHVSSTQIMFTTGVIPEPSSALLFLCGAALLMGSRRRL